MEKGCVCGFVGKGVSSSSSWTAMWTSVSRGENGWRDCMLRVQVVGRSRVEGLIGRDACAVGGDDGD